MNYLRQLGLSMNQPLVDSNSDVKQELPTHASGISHCLNLPLDLAAERTSRLNGFLYTINNHFRRAVKGVHARWVWKRKLSLSGARKERLLNFTRLLSGVTSYRRNITVWRL